jgi:hypothetical protein
MFRYLSIIIIIIIIRDLFLCYSYKPLECNRLYTQMLRIESVNKYFVSLLVKHNKKQLCTV